MDFVTTHSEFSILFSIHFAVLKSTKVAENFDKYCPKLILEVGSLM